MKKKEMKTKVMAVAMSATMAASICPGGTGDGGNERSGGKRWNIYEDCTCHKNRG